MAAFAVTIAAFMAVPASAAITYTEGDILLGFRASGGDGSTVSYIVDIGNYTQFQAGSSIANLNLTNSLGNLGADLAATYGDGTNGTTAWYERTDLSWGLVGKLNGSPNSTVFASDPQTYSGGVLTPSDPWSPLLNSALNSTKGQIQAVTATLGTATTTANSTKATLQTNVSNTSSYNYQVTNGATDFGTLSNWTSIEGNFGNGTAGTALDLYKFAPGSSVSNLGTFSISDSGVLSFTALAAAPEPSRALLLMGGALSFALRRRRVAARA